ncbi:MAG TPA: riboflavin synthase [Pseudolabrys sp.]|nr:riboflavin synthase [Pseudolabrys sp.]
MFTGIVTNIGEILSVESRANDLRRLRIACHFAVDDVADGASIACAGCCLTVVDKGVEKGTEGDRHWFAVDAAAETLSVTAVGRWTAGSRINLERSLKIGDELGGHLVSGHVDGLADVVAREDLGEAVRFGFRAPTALARFIAQKGSVALDGVSLTVNTVDGDQFSVLVIPHTLQVTTLGRLEPGAQVHLEVDQMARYAARLMETR